MAINKKLNDNSRNQFQPITVARDSTSLYWQTGARYHQPGSGPPHIEAKVIRRAQTAIAPFIERGQTRKKLAAPQATFELVANEWFEISKERWVETYRCRLRSRLDEDLLAELGGFFIDEIELLTVLSRVRAIEQRGAVESAKRIL